MDADLDTLCTVVYCTADDLLPQRQGNARRMVTDAEVVTLCVAQAIMGIRVTVGSSRSPGSGSLTGSGDSVAAGVLQASAPFADQLEWLMGMFASESPGSATICC